MKGRKKIFEKDIDGSWKTRTRDQKSAVARNVVAWMNIKPTRDHQRRWLLPKIPEACGHEAINRAKSRNAVIHQHCNLLHSTDYLRYLFADSSLFNRTTVFDNPSWLCSPDFQNSRVTSGGLAELRNQPSELKRSIAKVYVAVAVILLESFRTSFAHRLLINFAKISQRCSQL